MIPSQFPKDMGQENKAVHSKSELQKIGRHIIEVGGGFFWDQLDINTW